MKIQFVQLPLIDHSYNYIESNVPYASGTLAAYLNKNFSDIETVILPDQIANYSSDKVIVEKILKETPDIIAFSNYLWNVERHLGIALEIKKQLPNCKVVFGGPECSSDGYLFEEARDYVDYFFSGEGEWFFYKYFNKSSMDEYSISLNKNILISQPANELLTSDEIVEPVNAGVLKPGADGAVSIELTRGCPFKCSYCFYSKNSSKVREMPFELLTDIIKKRDDISEIYLLSPSFDRTPDFKKKLEILKDLNHEIILHAEIRTNKIDKDLAELIRDAGFETLEVGLQTLTEKALVKAGRVGSIEDELQGMQYLADAGVELKIGIIPGLPGDTNRDFSKTITKLAELGFEDSIEFYPLMVLPGTKVRAEAENCRLKYQKKPPYYFTESPQFSTNDVKRIKREIEELTGFSPDSETVPDFVYDEKNSIGCKGVAFNSDVLDSWKNASHNNLVETNIFSYHIKLNSTKYLADGLPELFSNKYEGNELYNLILYSNELLDDSWFSPFIKEFGKDSFYSRLKLYSPKSEQSRLRVYQVVNDLDLYKAIEKSSRIIKPIFSLDESSINQFKNITEDDDISILICEGIYTKISDKFIDIYEENIENVAFESFYEKKEFYEDLGIETVESDFSFSIKKI